MTDADAAAVAHGLAGLRYIFLIAAAAEYKSTTGGFHYYLLASSEDFS